MSPLLVSVFTLCFYPFAVVGCDPQLVKDFCLYKQTRRVVVVCCDEGLFATALELMQEGIYVEMHYFAPGESARGPIANASFLSEPATIVADASCPTFRTILEQGIVEAMFNSSYAWLIVTSQNTSHEVIATLERGCGLRLDSDVIWAREKANEDSSYQLVDLYSTNKHNCSPIRMDLLGSWQNSSGLRIIPYNRIETRKNFHHISLRGLLESSAPLTANYEAGIDQPGHFKYHLALMKFLQEVHNFSVNFERMEGPFSERISRFDVVGSGVLQSLRDKPVNAQIVHQSWSYSLRFIFRLTPEVNGVTREVSILSPFTGPVWGAVLVVIALALMALQLMGACHATGATPSHNHFLIDMIGLLAQQGTTERSASVPVRSALYAVLLMNFLLYNYYADSIVGELLSGTNPGPQTIEQLAECPLSVVFHNDAYNHALLEDEAALPSIFKLYRKQLQTPAVPVYADVATAVRLLKRGGFAFHCEPSEAFREIANQLDADEVCELRTMQGLFSKLGLMSFVLPKGSMYAAQFKITLSRANELGIIRRLLGMYRNEMPACQNGPLVQPVVMAGVATPFTMLGAGMFCSTFILLVENAVHYVKSRRTAVDES